MTWVSIYSHDAQGQPLTGSKADLVSLVERGKAVRVIYAGSKGNTKYKTVFSLDPVSTSGNDVHGQGRWVGYDFSPNFDHLTYDNDDAPYMLNVSTTGKVNRL